MAANPQKKRTTVRQIFAVIGKIFGTLVLLGVLTALVFACIFAKYVKEDLSTQLDFSFDEIKLDQTSTIFYYDPNSGKPVELQQLYATENRTWVSYSAIPADLRFACIAIEDKRFMEHQGVDWLRTLKASVNMFIGGDSTYGASTLTQQLIKNLTKEDEVTVRRKLIEIFRALEFEKAHSKAEIMEWYLNTIYLGEGCYGVQSASRVYFGKNVQDLTLAECASLIAITNNPSIFDPYINPEKNRTRQLDILYVMKEQGYILTQEEYDAACDQEMVFVNTSADKDDDESAYFSYFVDQVIRDVTKDLCEQYGYSEKLAEQLVRAGGYSIYCTLDPNVQAQVDEVYTNLDNIPNTNSAQQLQSGIVVINNSSGDVVAMAGGVGEKTGSLTFNRATQAMLSPGSTIKPITVYAPAFDVGLITPATVYDDTPYSFTSGATGRWPKNTDNVYAGLTTIRSAVSTSKNTVAVKVLADLTTQYSYDFASTKMGLDTLVDNEVINGNSFTDIDLSPLALGSLTRGVSIQDMAAAYATFASRGENREARIYTKVTNTETGAIILDNTQDRTAALSQKAAWYMTDMLQYAVDYGTGSAAKIEGMAVAGKTGTTTSDQDRWFCGYTPYYTAAVWCGYDVPEEVKLTDTTTNPALYLWHEVMERVHEGLEGRAFARPTDIVECSYCRDSGLLATDACRKDPRGNRVVNGKLSLADVPTGYCTTHKEVKICDASGKVANEFCAQVEGNSTSTLGLLSLMRTFPISGIVVQDQQYAYYDELTIPQGLYPALSPTGKAYDHACDVHTEDSLTPEEPEEPELPDNPIPDPENPDENQPDPWYPPVENPDGHEDPADGGTIPID